MFLCTLYVYMSVSLSCMLNSKLEVLTTLLSTLLLFYALVSI